MSPTLAARRARVAHIRRIVAAVAVTVFLALFATVYIQMAAGDDPALKATTTTTTTTSSTVSEPMTTAQS